MNYSDSMRSQDLERILVSEESIRKRISELGREIDAAYEGKEILLVTLLNGAIVFTADLIRNIRRPLWLDSLRARSYGEGTTSSGTPEITGDLRLPVEGSDVLLVDDILDTGNTLSRVTTELSRRNPASIKSCVLLDKKERRQTDFEADWVGFEIPDHFVVGYGLDYAERYRHFPYVGILKPEIYS
ncbi:MAG: hypoxanthine phosphoribosyltransferase [Opitutales bacterium]|jgi:hypoxanthine phosphoribosyltransferase